MVADPLDLAIARVERTPALVGSVTLTGRVHAPPVPVKRGQLIAFRWVPIADMPPEHLEYVRENLKRAALVAGLRDVVHFRFYRPAYGDGVADFVVPARADNAMSLGHVREDLPDTVCINADLEAGDALLVVLLHECRHIAQFRLWQLLSSDAYLDRDAEEFAAAHLAEVKR